MRLFRLVLAPLLLLCAPAFCAGSTLRHSLISSSNPTPTSLPASAVAAFLGAAVTHPPRLDAAMGDWTGALVFDEFFRGGGDGIPVTPTSARMLWDEQNLYLAFDCAEPSRYPWARVHHEGKNAVLMNADRVEVFLWPDFGAERFFHFAVTSQGQSEWSDSNGAGPLQTQDEGAVQTDEEREGAAARGQFQAVVARREGGWTASLSIPWDLVGGRPDGAFGLTPARFRHQSGEQSAPLALDHTYYPPRPNPVPSQFLEVHFGGSPRVVRAGAGLVILPSGAQFWNRPAVLKWPTRVEHEALWKLQQSLASAPTTPRNLAARVEAANSFHDALALEGFAFDRTARMWNLESGGQGEGAGVDPRRARARVNRLLRAGDVEGACQALDQTLREYDQIARRWWADGSVGDVRDELWAPLCGPLRFGHAGQELRVTGAAGGRDVALYLSLPSTGGVRLRGERRGYSEPPSSLPITIQTLKNGARRIEFAGGAITIGASPWSIALSDGAGREKWRLQEGDLRFRFKNAGAEVAAIDISHGLKAGEAVTGFGEWAHRFDQRGGVLTLWQQDAWEAFNGGLHNQSYKTIPFYHLGRGASVFYASSYRLRADVGQENPDRLRLTSAGPVLDLTVWNGAPLDNLRAYCRLTGTSWLPPGWAFEPWAGGGHKRWAEGPLKNATLEQIAAMQRLSALDIPHAALYAEGSGSSDPALYAALTPLGMRILTWNRNQVPGKFERDLAPDALPFLRRAQGGEVYRLPKTEAQFAPQFPYLDWSHPGAMDLWRQSWKHRLDLGVAGSMIDFGDWTPEDSVAFDGTRGDELHNRYALGYARAAHEVFREKRGNDFVLFARQATPGSQKYVAFFAGDYLTNFDGMRAAMRAGLSAAEAGLSNWSVELGGYSGGWPDVETYIRWTQWAAFSPLMRCHGQTPREPWEYDDDALANYKHCVWLRYNLLPAIYSFAQQANRDGTPMMRPLALAFPDAPELASNDDEYLFGPDLLVAPVMQGGNARIIAFPPGKWTHLWSGAAFEGGARQIAVPLDEIPVFLRQGAILPVELAPSLKWGESLSAGRVAALVVTPPRQKEARSWGTQGAVQNASSAPFDGGFEVELPAKTPQFLLVYGAKVAAVQVDGRTLAAENLTRADGRVALRLPGGARRVRVDF